MLVDDATVEIENIHRNHAMSKPLLVAILDGASQIATPTLVGTLSICIVFFPVVLLPGRGALSVHSAGAGGRLRDAHLLPALANAGTDDGRLPAAARRTEEKCRREDCGAASMLGFNRGFERMRELYRDVLGGFIAHRAGWPDLRGADGGGFDAAAVGGGRGFFPRRWTPE